MNHDDTTGTTKDNCIGQDSQDEQDVQTEQVNFTVCWRFRKFNPGDPVNPVYESRRARRVVVVNPTLRCSNKTMLDWSQCAAVERSPGKVSGAWLFKGTRVPVKALFENLEGGARVEEFLEWFPGVTRDQVDAVLEHAQQSLVDVS